MKKCNISLKENIPSSQDYQASKLPDMTSNRELQIRFLLFLAYKILDLMSYPVTLRADNPMKLHGIFSYKDILHFFIKCTKDKKYLKSQIMT